MLKELLEIIPTSVSLTGQVRAAIAARYITQLVSEGATDATIALFLNSKNLTTAHNRPFTETNVRKIRQRMRANENTSYNLGWK